MSLLFLYKCKTVDTTSNMIKHNTRALKFGSKFGIMSREPNRGSTVNTIGHHSPGPHASLRLVCLLPSQKLKFFIRAKVCLEMCQLFTLMLMTVYIWDWNLRLGFDKEDVLHTNIKKCLTMFVLHNKHLLVHRVSLCKGQHPIPVEIALILQVCRDKWLDWPSSLLLPVDESDVLYSKLYLYENDKCTITI